MGDVRRLRDLHNCTAHLGDGDKPCQVVRVAFVVAAVNLRNAAVRGRRRRASCRAVPSR